MPQSAQRPVQRGGSITIRHVAEHAGVSKSSVSRYLQDSPLLSEATRTAIANSIDRLGYRLNGAARSLTERRTNAVGVLANDLRQPWFVEFMEGLGEALHNAGYHMFIGDGRLDRRMDESLIHAFAESRVDGLVLAGTMPTSASIIAAIRTLPTVVAGNRDIDSPHVDVIAEDDRAAARMAMEHLFNLGHRHIGHISGAVGTLFDIRRDAYQESMRSRGLGDEITIEPCDTSERGGYDAGRRMLSSRGSAPTAVFAANDLTAIGAMDAAQDCGMSIPEDVAVVGVDNSFLGRMRGISLTSVDIAPRDQGEIAGDALIRRLAEPEADRIVRLVDPTLCVRGSTVGRA